jgi:hypothetical protein
MQLRGREDGLLVRRSGDEILLLDTLSDRIHQLNVTAAFVWHRLADGMDAQTIAEQLSDAFEVSEDAAKTDVAVILTQFRELGLTR